MLSASVGEQFDTSSQIAVVRHVGTEVVIEGTPGDDRLELSIAGPIEITLNGAQYEFDPAEVETIVFNGSGGNDTAILTGSAADETAVLRPGTARVSREGLLIEISGTQEITFLGGGGADVAHLYDSDGDDVFRASPHEAELTGDGFNYRVQNVSEIHGYARAGGNDTAILIDSAGDDTFIGRPTWARMIGEGFANRAKFFDVVHARATSGGNDRARVNGSRGDDTFVAAPGEATFSGDGYSHRMTGFDSVNALAVRGGVDRADLIDSPGDDTFISRPTESALFGDGFTNRAAYFDQVHAYARRGGYDMAYLHDSPGDDVFIGKPVWGKMIGDGFYNRAKFFDVVHAYADDAGRDAAYLYDSAADDSFVGRPDYSRLEGPNFVLRAGSFESVYATSRAGGSDSALLVDSEGADRLEADANWVQLTESESSRLYRATAFEDVRVRFSDDGNTVDVTPSAASLLVIEEPGDPAVVRANDFFDAGSPTQGIQDAIDALPAEGGIVVIEAGTWTLRQSLVLRDNVTLRGAGGETVLTRGSQLEARLTSPAAAGDTFVEVDSVEGFQVGDELGLFAYGQGVAHPIIARIEPGRITFTEPLTGDDRFDPADSAALVNYFAFVRAGWTNDDTPVQDVRVENLTFDGNLDETTQQWRIVAPGLINLVNVSDAVVRDSTFRMAFGAAVSLQDGHDNLIDNVQVDKSRGHGIYLGNETDLILRNSMINEAGYHARGKSGDGILVDGGFDVVIEGNTTENNLRYGLHPGGELLRGGRWSDNVSRRNGSNGFHFCWDNFDVRVEGNRLYDNGRSGIGGLGLGGPFGDRFNVITDNEIFNNQRWGIEINGGSDNIISDNLIYNNSQKGDGRYSGILLRNASDVAVRDNRIGSDGGVRTQKYGIEEYGDADSNFLVRNDVRENIEGGILLVGANTQVSGNLGTVAYPAP